MKRYFNIVLGLCLVCLLCFVSACTPDTSQSQPVSVQKAQQQSTNDGMTKMTVYIPRDDGRGVRPQEITIDKANRTVKEAINLMIIADLSGKYPVYAKGTAVKEANLKEGVLTLVMTKPFLQGATDNLTSSLRLIAVVNTATEFKEVKVVRLQVEGTSLDTYGGFDLTEPLRRMESKIIK